MRMNEIKPVKSADGLPRGGLCANALRAAKSVKSNRKPGESAPRKYRQPKPAEKAPKPTAAEPWHLPKILGYTATSVIRLMASKGIDRPRIKTVLEANGCGNMTPGSLSVQIYYGRAGLRGVAKLTQDEIDKLLATVTV